jgi:hypothetical protein
MNPYRQLPAQTIVNSKRTFFGKIRSWWRRKIIGWNGGLFLQRFPVKCDHVIFKDKIVTKCSLQSWDPRSERLKRLINHGLFKKKFLESIETVLFRMNYYRCGHEAPMKPVRAEYSEFICF